MEPEFTGLLFTELAQNLVWAFMKPIAIRMLAREIDFGVQAFLDDEADEWSEFPLDMDRLFRNLYPGYNRMYPEVKRPPPPWETV